ncbi:glycosyltransferase [Vibrio scophthalmi]|uniref:glycosyltransferase n=1 Tax=Vibrio scophthalmi TaxID=45658 RepID=UPI0022843E1E|nr:glycosyltransferase [Vibrio scophthalmi]MCY9804592.1 glycosyltransferase [Vibrio scophthalmi]
MKYSVIVPIYNTFDYAQRIVEWFVQEVSARSEQDAELILVDDGSKQGPNYTIDHQSIRLIRKENGGVSSARNVGIENARGEFILFLDSDDKYQSGLFSYLDKVLLERTNLDTILFSFEKVSDDKSEQAQNRAQQVTGQQALSQYLTKEIRLHICGLMVSRRLLSEHSLRFDESLHFSEDLLFIIDYLSFAHDCYISDEILYFHVMRSGSAINSPLTQKDTTHIDAFAQISTQAKKLAREQDVNFFISTCYINLIKFLIKNKTQDKDVFEKIISNQQFLFGELDAKLSRYSFIVMVLRLLFKLDGLTQHRVLRRLSYTG